MRISRATLRHWNKQRIAERVAKWEAERVAILADAAPDLLAALQDLLNATEETYDNRHERQAAMDAIARATGSST